MTTPALVYPQTGTKAEKVLHFIRDNPGTSRNAIINRLELNPAMVRKAVQALLDHGAIMDQPNERGHHRYTEVGSILADANQLELEY